MIKKYFDFLQFISESKISFSPKFKNILGKINDDISNYILSLEDNDQFDVLMNFFDISDKNDKVSYISDRKYEEIVNKKYVKAIETTEPYILDKSEKSEKILSNLMQLANANEMHSDVDLYNIETYSPNIDEIGEVISQTFWKKENTPGYSAYYYVVFRDFSTGEELGRGVYTDKQVVEIDPKIILKGHKSRQEIKVSKAIKSLLDLKKYKYTGTDIENFVNKFKSAIDAKNDKLSNFEIVKGKDIAKYYKKEKTIFKKDTTLGKSCMLDKPDSYFKIYTENTTCSMVILKSDDEPDKLIARALLWELESGDMFLDRVYYNNDSDQLLFSEYAVANGFIRRNGNSFSTPYKNVIKPDGSNEYMYLSVKVEDLNYTYYPFLDTLKYYDAGSDILHNDSDYSYDYVLTSTTGEYITCGECEDSSIECSSCDGAGSTSCGDCRGSGETDCGHCWGEGYHECSSCDGSGWENDDDECGDCSGNGRIDCDYCSGGSVECDGCGGHGSIDCDNCWGSGSQECSRCGRVN
jgi:hypothetical protein